MKDLGAPKRIVHLATGREVPFSVWKDGKTVLEFPADFPRDAHADAFEIFMHQKNDMKGATNE